MTDSKQQGKKLRSKTECEASQSLHMSDNASS